MLSQFIFVLALVCLNPNTAQASTREPGWDRPGYDYFSYDMYNDREILCSWRCENESRCKAWTYVKAGVQGPKARCWLKHSVPKPVPNNCCVSGVK